MRKKRVPAISSYSPAETETLSFAEANSSDETLSSAKALCKLAANPHSRADYEESERLCKRLLELRIRDCGSRHLYVAEALRNFADVCKEQEKYLQAEALYWHALLIVQNIYSPDYPLVLDILRSLAELYEEIQNFGEAERLFRWSLRIKDKMPQLPCTKVTHLMSSYAKDRKSI
jgi:tetratricopeptide (TPR) repeat protein